MDTDRKWFKLEPLNIVDKRADSEHYGVYDVLSPKYIVIHATGGVDSVAWLTTRSTPPVSSHRLISRNGTIYKLVPDISGCLACREGDNASRSAGSPSQR